MDPEIKRQREEWRNESEAIETKLKKPLPEWLEGFEEWLAKKPTLKEVQLREASALAPEERSEKQTRALEQYYVRNVSPETKSDRDRMAALTKKLNATKTITVPVMAELPESKQRKTFIQLRGNWQALGEEVRSGVPKSSDRCQTAFAKSIRTGEMACQSQQPAYRRVVVNRYWESVFGVGIVRTSEEFGSQGICPSIRNCLIG